MQHLPLVDERLHRPGHVLDRHRGVDPVLIEQVDALHPQPRERGVADFADMFGPAVEALDRLAGLGLVLRAETESYNFV